LGLGSEDIEERPTTFPGGENDPDTLKGEMGSYFAELVAAPQVENNLLIFIGRTTATAECKSLDKPITKEGFINLSAKAFNESGKLPVYCLVIEDTIYFFRKRVVDGKTCDLPFGSVTVQEVDIKLKGTKIVIDSPTTPCELICNSDAEASDWLDAVNKASQHEDEELGTELTATQQQTLNELKENFHDSDERELLRFLQAHAWNKDLVEVLYKSHLQWKDDVRVDQLKINSVYNTLSSGRVFYTNTKDKKGRPILVFRARLHDPSQDFFATMMVGMYLLERAIEDAGDAQQIVLINDLNGFEKKNNDFRMNKLMLEMVLAHFPNRVGAIWCVSTPWIFRMVFRVIKPWLGDELVSRVHLFGGTSELREFIAEDQLLTDFGGKCKEDIRGWAEERARIEGVNLDKPEPHQFKNEEIVAAFSDAPVSQTANGCLYQGWLKKQGGFVKKFNKRYCVLKGTILYYYRGQNDSKADGVVFLRGARLAADHSSTFHIITSAGKDCIFQLADKKQTQWLKVLENVIVSNGGSIGKSGGESTVVDPVDSFGITWQPQSPKAKGKKKSADPELMLDTLFLLYQDPALRIFPEGHVPGNEIVDLLVKHTLKSREESIAVANIWIEHQFLFPLSPKAQKFADSEDQTFIFTFLSPTNVLNVTRIAKQPANMHATEILEGLHMQLVQLIKLNQEPDGSIDFAALKQRREYFNFLVATSDLQLISMDSIKDQPTFFFNLRSMMLLHAQIHHGIGTDCDTRLRLFTGSQYIVGMNRFSLTDIGHGILRANTGAPESLLSKHFLDKKDPRLKFALKSSNEQVVFALFPGITLDAFHYSTDLSETITEATNKFMSDFIALKEGEIHVSVILTWVNTPDKIAFVAQFMPEESRNAMKGAPIVLKNVDWDQLGLGSLLS